MSNPYLSVVVPAFNEESRLEESLIKILNYLDNREFTYQVLVIDDGSSDRTFSIASKYVFEKDGSSLEVHKNESNRGKGYSVRRGMLEARGEFALLTDTDLSAPIEELEKLEEAVFSGECDIAFGSRDVKGSQVVIHQPWLRENAGKAFNWVVRFLTALPYKDTQCGFKLFKMNSCKDIFRKQRIEKYAFDVEILFVARKWGLVAREIPVLWKHSEDSKVRLFPDAPLTGLDLIRIHLLNLLGYYRRANRETE